MNKTTLFLPIGLGQAAWCFENRAEAFAGGFNSAESGLAGYQNRDDAIAAGATRHVHSFGVLHLTITHELHEQLAYSGQLKGTEVGARSGSPLWTLTPEACALLAHPCKCEMTMEIVPATTSVADSTEGAAAGTSCSRASGCCGTC